MRSIGRFRNNSRFLNHTIGRRLQNIEVTSFKRAITYSYLLVPAKLQFK